MASNVNGPEVISIYKKQLIIALGAQKGACDACACKGFKACNDPIDPARIGGLKAKSWQG